MKCPDCGYGWADTGAVGEREELDVERLARAMSAVWFQAMDENRVSDFHDYSDGAWMLNWDRVAAAVVARLSGESE